MNFCSRALCTFILICMAPFAQAQDQLNIQRSQVDSIIQQIWNEVEETFNELPEEMRREKASEYGLVYVFRKNELSNTKLFQTSRIG